MMGGGTWVTENKVLPGIYINFISLTRSAFVMADRGYVALPLTRKWGKDVTIIKIEDFEKNSLKLTGYQYTDEENKPLRDIFKHSHTIYLGRLNNDGVKASCAYGEALYPGERGNDIKIVITANVDDPTKYDVTAYLGTEKIDSQTVATAAELVDNDFIKYNKKATLAETAGTPFENGTDGTVTANSHQEFLNKMETYAYNILICDSTDSTIKTLYVNYTKRMRYNIGVKFQTVLYSNSSDNIGCINVTTKATEGDNKLVYWFGGLEAGCAINKSCANVVYDGEYTPIIDLTQEQLVQSIKNGEMVLHKVGSEIRTLEDKNSLITLTDTENEDFQDNQTIRIIDQIGNDMASLFNTRYNSKVPNDVDGRLAFMKDISKLYKGYQNLRAIQNFDPDEIVIEAGERKDSVVIDAPAHIVNCMKKAYMRVVIA